MNDGGPGAAAGPEGARAPNLTRLLFGLLAASVIARVLWVLFADPRSLTFRTTDDAYYYYQVARNVTHGAGLTFDGIHPTNGFHPLWMAMILPIFAWAGNDPIQPLRAVQVLETLVAACTVLMGWLCVRDIAGERAAFVAALLAMEPFAQYPLLNGLETGILVLALFSLAWTAMRRDLFSPHTGPGGDAALGALLGFAFLARLDSVFLVPSCAFVILWRARREIGGAAWLVPAVRKLAVIGGVFTALSAPYLLWNFATFHHFVPISGSLKSTFPRASFALLHGLGFNAAYGLVLIGITTVLLAWLTVRRDRALRGRALAFCWALWGGNVLHFGYSLAFVDWGAQWWHFVAYLPLTLIVAALVFGELDRRSGFRRAAPAIAAIVAVVLFGASITGDTLRRGDTRSVWYDAAAWERDSLPKGAVLAMTDCGFIGYMGGHQVVNLDGVINGYEFQDALLHGRLAEFLSASGVTYVGEERARYRDGQAVVLARSRLVRGPWSEIVCTPQAEVYRSREYVDEPMHPERGNVRFVIWDFRRVRVVSHE